MIARHCVLWSAQTQHSAQVRGAVPRTDEVNICTIDALAKANFVLVLPIRSAGNVVEDRHDEDGCQGDHDEYAQRHRADLIVKEAVLRTQDEHQQVDEEPLAI